MVDMKAVKNAYATYSVMPELSYKIIKKAVDARKKQNIIFVYSLLVTLKNNIDILIVLPTLYRIFGCFRSCYFVLQS